MARRADDYLGDRLREIPGDPGPHRDARLRFARHALSAFREIGLLDDEQAAAWDGRLARAAEDPLDRPRLTREVRAAAGRHLERLVADLEGDPGAPARIHGAFQALEEVGALSPGEAARWRERAFPPPPDVAALRRFAKTHLARVARGPAEPVDGLCVTLVELYADGVTVNWHERPARVGEQALRRIRSRLDEHATDLAEPSLTDDAGTAFVFYGSSSGGGIGDRATIGRSDFAPAPAPTTRSLVFESLGRRFRIRLDA